MYGSKVGELGWMDLTVENADDVQKFYQKVVGWKSTAISMQDNGDKYNDFVMTSEKVDEKYDKSESNTQEFATGICHAKGNNSDIPAAWLPYFLVAELNSAIEQVKINGGVLITQVKYSGKDSYIIIKDPAGAMSALYQKNSTV
jgi:predicted enzyme related to lactoylglutathione lyase